MDTPNQKKDYGGTFFSGTQTSCESNDMYMNYMDYTFDAQMNMFTQDQKKAMRTTLNAGGFRENFGYVLPSISSPSDLCTINKNFIVSGLPVGLSAVSWSVSPASFVSVASGSGASATFKAANSDISGEATITFLVNGNCTDNASVSKKFCVGRPTSIGGSISGPSTATIGQLVTYTHSNPVDPNGGTYDWTLPYDVKFCSPNCWSVFTGGDGNNQIRAIAGSSSGYVQVRKTNACGNGGAKVLYVTVPSGGGGGGGIEIQAIVSPNPVDTPELKITFVSKVTGDPIDLADFGYEVEYTIRNMQGNVKHQSKSKKKKQKININKLAKNKQYILTVKYGDKGHENIHVYIE